ncbi:hypothetical protein ACLNBI_18375 [Pseudomonas guariconensis]|uniref:hypothetical protein n=1 Tax=Pseudomonas guariconensis TaxID=1288410 RepID=UPI0039E8AC12
MGELALNNVTTFSMGAIRESAMHSFSGSRPDNLSRVSLNIKPATAVAHNLAYEMRKCIDDLAALPNNWDGYGAIPVNQAAIDNARSAVGMMFANLPEADIFANPNGTITFEWENEKGTANLEIGDTRFAFYIEGPTETPYTLAGKAENISWLLSHNIFSALYAEQAKTQSITAIRFYSDDSRFS